MDKKIFRLAKAAETKQIRPEEATNETNFENRGLGERLVLAD